MRILSKLTVHVMIVLGLAWPAVVAESTSAEASCRHGNGIGVSRTVSLNTTGGARFGSSHGGHRDFLRDREVVLTFDDGPVPGKTTKVLDVLQRHCTKATFFMVGRMADNHKSLVKKVLAAGHTVGAHGYSHRNLGHTNGAAAMDDVRKGIKAINKAAGRPTTAFFRFPYLSENRTVNSILKQRDYGVFSIDVDSWDYKFSSPSSMVNRVMSELNKKGKGIILLHDIQNVTAKGIDQLLTRLHEGGYKVVHVRGANGQDIDEPLLLASADAVKTGTAIPPKAPNSSQRASYVVKRPKAAANTVSVSGQNTRQKPSAKPIRARIVVRSPEQPPAKKAKTIRVAKLSERQRDLIKKRQGLFKSKLEKNRQTFKAMMKKRLITQ